MKKAMVLAAALAAAAVPVHGAGSDGSGGRPAADLEICQGYALEEGIGDDEVDAYVGFCAAQLKVCRRLAAEDGAGPDELDRYLRDCILNFYLEQPQEEGPFRENDATDDH